MLTIEPGSVDNNGVPVDNEAKPLRFKEIRGAILREVEAHPADLITFVADSFGVSRQAVHRQARRLVGDGLLIVEGDRRQARYRKAIAKHVRQVYPLTGQVIEEDVVWREFAVPVLEGLRSNVLSICLQGFTEMVNNVIDHSLATLLTVVVDLTADEVELSVFDNGIGIFNKIQQACALETPEQAIFELSKGKLTTDPSRHTGEGIFFTSRIFDRFSILSGGLWFGHAREETDWLINDFKERRQGTAVFMKIALNSTHTTKEVFDRFSTTRDGMSFDKTVVALDLAHSGPLVSRSQAKRVLAHLDRFKEVILDFADVPDIGQAFADEIFRVYRANNPSVSITYIHANESITAMIRRADMAEVRTAVRSSAVGSAMRELMTREEFTSASESERWAMLREAIAERDPSDVSRLDSIPVDARNGVLKLFTELAQN